MDFLSSLKQKLQENASAENAVAMAKYMKDNFPFLGIRTDVRRRLLKETVVLHKGEVAAASRSISIILFDMPEREYHYCAIDILMKELLKKFIVEDIGLIEKLLITKSWWDSVDLIAKYLLGGYLKHYPKKTDEVIKKFATSRNMWLNRSAILYQLGYKKDTDMERLFSLSERFSDSKEFFIQKAIGWALREYAKTNPDAVKTFVPSAQLKPLSAREALKNI